MSGGDIGTSTWGWGGAHPPCVQKFSVRSIEWAYMWRFKKPSKRDMNGLILRFLMNQGYDDAVKKFIMEAGPESGMDLGIWIGFLDVQKDLQSGNVDDAVEKLKNLNPVIINQNHGLLCILLLQEFVELIRTGKFAEALEFSQERLAPEIKKNRYLFSDFAEITSLLTFKDDPDSPAAKFLDPAWRSMVLNEIKDTLFRSQRHAKDLNVPNVVKELKLAQEQLDNIAVYPRIHNLYSVEIPFGGWGIPESE